MNNIASPPNHLQLRSIAPERDAISLFIDSISQSRSEEWRKKVIALQTLIVNLDRQQIAYYANRGGIAAAAGGSGDSVAAENELEDDNYSLRSMESDISALSSPSKAGSVHSFYNPSNRAARQHHGRIAGYHAPTRSYAQHISSSRSVSGMPTGGGSSDIRPSPSRVPVPVRVRVPSPSASGRSTAAALTHSLPPISPSRKATITSPSSASKQSHSSTATPSPNNRPLYKQPKELRRLAPSFQKLFTDLRSQVVKAACTHLATLAEHAGDAARLLVRDVLPDLIDIHRQTVKVMHGYALSCMITIIHFVKFKTCGLTVILDHGRKNKSKDVRCACVRYLHEIVEWYVLYVQ